jgi:hypothetical protein
MINHTIQPENVKRFVTLNHPDGVKEVYFVLIIDTEKPPWILTRVSIQSEPCQGTNQPWFLQASYEHRQVAIKGHPLVVVEATYEDHRDHKDPI